MASSPPVLKRTAGEIAQADVAALLKSRHTLLWVASREEARVERAITEAAGAAGMTVALWDCQRAFTDPAATSPETRGMPWSNEQLRSPVEAVALIESSEQPTGRTVFVMRDLHQWLRDPSLLRALRNAQRSLQVRGRNDARAIVILAPSADVPPDLADHCTVLDYPLPDRSEIEKLVRDCVAGLDPALRETALPAASFEAAVDAAIGLSAEEAANCISKSIVTTRKVDPIAVAQEKKRVVSRERVLTWIDPDPRGVAAIGGLDLLKQWLAIRHGAFSADAREFGLPAPKGVMLVGVPGCGKSLTAKCIATAWGVPLLRLDMGGLKSKFVGESEGNIRKALKLAETVSPCVVWLDEIEKALAGASGPAGDGGVSSDALGTILSWMQDRTGSVFVIATANDVTKLPPELLRKGRFDEMFFIDLPTPAERREILKASLLPRKLPPSELNVVADAMSQFTGSEIAAVVPDALFTAYNDGKRPLQAGDLIAAAKDVVPLAKTAADKIADLRQWAKGRARPASRQEQGPAMVGAGGRQLDA